METKHVVAAIIIRDGAVFATQRGYGEWKDWWEYPGGKVEPGESPEAALVREIREELDTEINVDKFLTTIEWDYPKFHLSMRCYICSLAGGDLRLVEHEAARWLSSDQLDSVRWLPADDILLPMIACELGLQSLAEAPHLDRPLRERLYRQMVCKRFRTDEHYRSGHIHIIAPAPGTVILGLHTPEMKAAAKVLARRGDISRILDDWQADGALTHDERIIWGLTLNYMKCPVSERVERIRAFLPVIDNWAICDTFCCNAKWVRGDDIRPFILDCIREGQPEFTRRVGLVLMMCHFLDGEHLERTFSDLASMKLQPAEPYYVQMAVAWLLATALAKAPDATRRFVASAVADPSSTPAGAANGNSSGSSSAGAASLPQDIIRLYVRKARESRITRNVPAL